MVRDPDLVRCSERLPFGAVRGPSLAYSSTIRYRAGREAVQQGQTLLTAESRHRDPQRDPLVPTYRR